MGRVKYVAHGQPGNVSRSLEGRGKRRTWRGQKTS